MRNQSIPGLPSSRGRPGVPGRGWLEICATVYRHTPFHLARVAATAFISITMFDDQDFDSRLFSPDPSDLEALPTRRREQERLLRACNSRFHDLLNLEVLYPHLVQESLLTRYEMERLQSLGSTLPDDAAKIDHLLTILPRKGKKSLKRFVRCLLITQNGTAHDELARCMIDVATEGETSINRDDFTETKTGTF